MRPVEPTGDKCFCCNIGNIITDALSKVINDIFKRMLEDDRRRSERGNNGE